MKKRLILMLVAVLLCLGMTVGLTSCMKKDDYHTKSDVNSLISELKTEMETKIAGNETAIANLKAEYNEKVALLESKNAENRDAIISLTDTYTNKVAELAAQDKLTSEALAALTTKYETDLAALNKADADNKTAIEALDKEYTDKVAELEAQDKLTADALAALTTKYEADLAALNKADADNKTAIEALDKEYTDKVAELAAQDKLTADALAALTTKYEADLAALNKADADNTAAIDALNKEYDDKVAELEASDKATADELAALTAKYETDLAALNKADADNAAAIEALEKEYTDKVAELTAQDKLTSEALAALTTEYAKSLAVLNKADADNSAAIEALNKEYDDKVAELEASDKATADELAALTKQHETDLAALNKADADNSAAIAALDEKYATESAALRAILIEVQNSIVASTNAYTEEINAINAKIDENNKKISEETAALEASIAALTDKHNSEIAELNSLIAELESVDAENADKIAELEDRVDELVTKYTVSFDLNGGKGNIPDQQVMRGNKVAKPEVPTREGYDFLGWYVDGEQWSFVGHVVTEDMTLTAKWELVYVVETVEKTTQYVYINAAAVSPIEGNSLSPTGSGNFVQYQQRTDPNGDGKYSDGAAITGKNQLDAWIVTSNDGDPYVTFWAGEFQNGSSQWNFQNNYSNNGPILTDDSYYVVDLDIATASELISGVAISLPNRNVVGEWEYSGGFPFGTNVVISDYVTDLGKEWTHFTIVCSMKTNKQYIFVNGEYLGTTAGVAYNASQVDESQNLRANGIKIEIAYDEGHPSKHQILANQSVSFDNVARRDIVDAEGIAALDAIFAAETPDITAWAGYPTNIRTGSLPVYVEIDGVQYNDLGEVYKILHGNTDVPKQVKLLNNFPVLWVRCDAVIDMNGYSCEIYSPEGATETVDGNTVTVDAPYIASQTDSQTGDSGVMMNAFRPAGDTFAWSFQVGNFNSANGIHAYISETFNGDKFVTLKGHSGVDVMSNTYIDINHKTDITYNGGAAQYMVYDLDAALLSGDVFPFMVIARKNGSGMWGAVNPSFNVLLNNQIGKFYHLTIVVDIANNDIYAYANNTLTYFSATNGFTSDSNHASFAAGDSGWNFYSLRFGSNSTGGLSFDNLQYRHITGADAEALKTALSDKDITDWSANIYNASYVLPKFGEVAFIGENAYYTADDLSAVLSGNDIKNVTIARSVSDPITVNCNAVIETNGFDVNIELGEGVTATQIGTIITTVYTPSN